MPPSVDGDAPTPSEEMHKLVSSQGGVSYLGRDADRTSHSDVVLCLSGGGRVRTHRALLAAGCELLRASLRWLPNSDDDAVIILPDFQLEEVRVLLLL